MKLLENTIFDSVSSYIITNAIDFVLDVRFEAYSCKMIATDKKEWKKSLKKAETSKERSSLPSNDPSKVSLLVSPSCLPSGSNNLANLKRFSEMSSSSENDNEEGNLVLVSAVSRRTLFDIVKLLNLSYPDYDFTETKSESFIIVSYKDCVQSVESKFMSTVNNYSRVRNDIWKVINDEIKVSECMIYSYLPNYSDDPFIEDGCMWSFNYFFHNKKLKRFLFFACRGLPKPQNVSLSYEQLYGPDKDCVNDDDDDDDDDE